MSVSIKTAHEIELMRESGHLLEKVHDALAAYIKPGISTKELDRIGEQMIRDLGCTPNFLNYAGFPGSFVSVSMMRWFMEYLRKKKSSRTEIW